MKYYFYVDKNLKALLKQEDTDGDKKITVDDKGPKKFNLISIDGKKLEVWGTYYLSVLLQELYFAKESKKKILLLNKDIIFQNPVKHASELIRNIFWNGLTRSIDESNLKNIISDSKIKPKKNYIYVPLKDANAYNYFKRIEKKEKKLNLSVIKLPSLLNDNQLKNINKKPGLLTLGFNKNKRGKIKGIPFVVPGGRFNEMYGWDSYFESLGLIIDGKIDLAVSMAENFFYEIEHYGKILNANRTYYLNRSQPPFLTSLILEISTHQKKKNKLWLHKATYYAIKEYLTVWTASDRLTSTGLSRYFGSGSGMPPETEPSHFNDVIKPFAKKYKMGISQFRTKYLNNEITDDKLEEYFLHDRSVRESGHDTSYRLEGKCAHLNTVDLNSLLYKYEIDLAEIIKYEFNNKFKYEEKIYSSLFWLKKAAARKKIINKLLWDEKRGFFFDYNFVTKRKTNYESATTFYPLWANIVTNKQAALLVKMALPLLEEAGGLAGSTKSSRELTGKNKQQKQWDYPFGWAPHQIIIWQGLKNYGYLEDSTRLAYKWLYTIVKNFADYNGTIPEKYNVVSRSHKVFAEYGNVGTDFEYITKEGFGWMNASFKVGLNYLSDDLKTKLANLIPPEWIFKK